MSAPRLAILVLSAGLLAIPAQAADAPYHDSCLTKAEQRAAVTANKAISLAQAIKVLREHRRYSGGPGQVVPAGPEAGLCADSARP